MSFNRTGSTPVAPDKKQFFVLLGERMTALRKEHGLTQQQLAEQLGIAQQTLAHYEGARLRVAASMLPTAILPVRRSSWVSNITF